MEHVEPVSSSSSSIAPQKRWGGDWIGKAPTIGARWIEFDARYGGDEQCRKIVVAVVVHVVP